MNDRSTTGSGSSGEGEKVVLALETPQQVEAAVREMLAQALKRPRWRAAILGSIRDLGAEPERLFAEGFRAGCCYMLGEFRRGNLFRAGRG